MRFRAAAALVLLAQPLAAQGIRGRVVEAGSDRPVALARIAAAAGDTVAGRTVTARDGHFSMALPPGSYRLHVARAGYQELRSTEIVLGPADTVEVELRAAARALRLEPLTVSAPAARRRIRELELSGSYRRARTISSEVPTDSVTARAARGRVAVRGRFAAPDECHHLVGGVATDPRSIELTVRATPIEGGCPGTSGGILYDSGIRGLAPGSYRLRVIHAVDGLPDRVVLDTSVVVP